MAGSPRKPGRDVAFVGRARELEIADGLVDDVARGNGHILLLAGEAGIGKTQLLNEIAQKARRRRLLVLRGRCEENAGRSFGAFYEALDGYVAEASEATLRRQLGDHAGVLAQLVPRLRERLGEVAEPVPLQPNEERTRLLDAVMQFLIAVGAETSLLLVVDDLHWADDDTLALFRHVGRMLANHRILLLGAYRGEEVESEGSLASTLSVLRRHRYCERVTLSGLAEAEVTLLLQTLAEQRSAAWSPGPVDPDLTTAISADTKGNPFFVRSLMLHLEEEGRLRVMEGCWHALSPIGERTAPEDIRQVLQRRIARLKEPTRAFLSVAAVVGARFGFEIVRMVAELGEEQALGAIDESIGAQVIEPSGTVDRYHFVHALVRQTFYETLGSQSELLLHRGVAEAMEQVYQASRSDHAAAIAEHYYRSRSLQGADRGVEYALLAADGAERSSAREDVAKFLSWAADLVDARDQRHIPISRRLGLALALCQRFQEAIALADRSSDSIVAKDRRQAAEYLAEVIGVLSKAGSKLGGHLVAKAKGCLDDRRDRTWVEIMVRDIIRREAETESVGFPPETPERVEVSRVIRSLDIGGSLEFWLLGFDAPRSRAEARARVREGSPVFRVLTGDYRSDLARLEAEAAQLEHDGALGHAATWWATVARSHNALGQFRGAQMAVGRVEAIAARLGPESAGPRDLSIVRYERCRAVGEGWEALAPAPSAVNDDATPDSAWLAAAFRSSLCLILASLGRGMRAVRLLEENVVALRRAPGWLFGYPMVACEAAVTLWLAECTDHLDTIEQCVRDKVLAADFRWYMVDARNSLACLCALRGGYDEAADWFAQARAALDEQGARPLRAITDYDEALMYHRRGESGDVERARSLLDAALAQFREIGMPGWIRRAECLLHTGREWSPGTAPPQTSSTPATAAPASLPPALFLRDGDSWRIAYAGKESRLAHSRGLDFLAQLLSRPGREIASIELIADPHGEDPVASGSDKGEQARVNVRRAIVLALRKIAAQHPVLGEHLTRTIRTGASCAYAPDPLTRIEWTTSMPQTSQASTDQGEPKS